MLMTLDFGNGRVFHTVLGHADYSMNCVGFITTLQPRRRMGGDRQGDDSGAEGFSDGGQIPVH